jgi:hypothetical protein
MKKKYYVTAFALVGSVISLTPLHAGVLFTFEEVGDDVVATTSGSIAGGWDTPDALTPINTSNTTRTVLSFFSIRYEIENTTYFQGRWTEDNRLIGLSLPADLSGVGSGDAFGFSANSTFYAPAGTTVGDAVTPDTTITWAGETFASMGLDQALSTTPLVLFTLDNNETISAVLSTGGSGGVSAIPEPSSLLGLAGLMTASTFLRRRRPRS